MAQDARVYPGKTFRLQRALDLLSKPRLTHAELTHLVEGGRLCTRQGLDLLACRPQGLETARTLEALLITSGSLVAKAREHLEAGIPSDTGPLNAEIDETMRESFFLSHWLDRINQPDGPRYDA